MPEMRQLNLNAPAYGQKFLAPKEKSRYNQEQRNCKI